MKSNKIKELPILNNCTELRILDLGYNEIEDLGEEPCFRSQQKLVDLILSHNKIRHLQTHVFGGLKNLKVLDLQNNLIEEIDENAFLPLNNLIDLNIGNNHFPSLPSAGLENLRQIKAFGNANLKQFPEPKSFPKIHTLALSYAYHCCQYLASNEPITNIEENIIWLEKDDVDMSIWNASFRDVWPNSNQNFSHKFAEYANHLWYSFNQSVTMPDNLAQYAEEYFEDYKSLHNGDEHNLHIKFPIKCLPQPSPFMPCEDLFDWWTLRCGVWVVFLLALLGNGVVVIVLLFGRSKLDVPRFLVCNLAIADFFMGIYLGMLAVVDAATLGEFKVYAIAWQSSIGCQVAGFLGVLSSELSVYTLAVITMERNYAITHAMHLNKRLSLKHASYIMSIGWFFALLMAILPFLGVSDYRKFAVCLPFEIGDSLSMAFVISLLLINGLAFLILMACYLRMYCAIRGSQAWNSNDSRIARRMALLVFTDFLCWAPIAFFSLTAVLGIELVSLGEAKVFTVFILPLNSCANPFLYAIFTKQFKKDCVMLCKRIEESRVTRGIGRCKHSSNFSNRHTPINTNSAVEKRSADGQQNVCQCGIPVASKTHTDGSTNHKVNFKTSKIKHFASKFLWLRRKERIVESTDSTSFQSSLLQNTRKAHKRLDSVSSENFSSRSDSWRQAHISLKPFDSNSRTLLHQQRRRSSWTASSSTSTTIVPSTRSSVTSDSSNGSKQMRSMNTSNLRAFSERHKNLMRPQRVQIARGLCPDCSRKELISNKESIANKEDDFERKFQHLFNRLLESSQEEGSESKEEANVLSSGESNRVETAETSLQDSIGTDSLRTDTMPTIALPSPKEELQLSDSSNAGDSSNGSGLYPDAESGGSSSLSIRTQIQMKDCRIEKRNSCGSLSIASLPRNTKQIKPRKGGSDTSLKTSLKYFPPMLKDYSGQCSQDESSYSAALNAKNRNQRHYSNDDVYALREFENRARTTRSSSACGTSSVYRALLALRQVSRQTEESDVEFDDSSTSSDTSKNTKCG
ncbi:leucine-rich repeat-containing G-protein coupled receptor 5-like protein [Dinothrombium tinctorium]|uniref:Leucine-rich repeat-containing G-protein coupled receptor 5-like protein n=1 Tax=Dinothrombium tinctorium TaxID=1965070 RepID=A0A3S3SDG5_9ACAR|nr:leucine-rich repeat-containing G-protein coupled receptor 5-like protein [Dinothrombium tinctorium]